MTLFGIIHAPREVVRPRSTFRHIRTWFEHRHKIFDGFNPRRQITLCRRTPDLDLHGVMDTFDIYDHCGIPRNNLILGRNDELTNVSGMAFPFLKELRISNACTMRIEISQRLDPEKSRANG